MYFSAVMSTAALPVLAFYATPVRNPIRWVTGSASIALAIGAAVLTVIGHQLSLGANGAFGEVWQGAMLAVLSIAAAVVGLATGGVDSLFGKGDRTLSILGVVCNVAFGGIFYAMWM